MDDGDRDKFADIMRGLHEIFTPSKDISAERVEIYWRVFKGWDIDRFSRACSAVMQSKTISTFPLPGEIIEASGEKERALEAWIEARQAVGRHGAYMSVVFPDRVIHSVIEVMGGWPKFCWCTDEERPFRQREFERLYNIMANRSPDSHPDKLQGLHDTQHNTVQIGGHDLKIAIEE